MPRSAPLFSILTGLILALSALQAAAQGIIRDAEIERGLRELAAPILRESGLPAGVRVIVVNDGSLNAFVADARHIFITSGLLMRMERPAELQAVLAHEAAHIANGHLTRRPLNAARATTNARLGLLLALAAGVAGQVEAAGGLALGTQSAALRGFLAHTRAEEASADQAALTYMLRAGIDPAAMRDVLDLFRGQEVLSVERQDPYVRTHPLTRDRIRSIEAFIIGRGGDLAGAPPDPAAQYWFDRLTGKLSAFLQSPRWTLDRIGDDRGEIATLRRAIALHRAGRADAANRTIAALIAARPSDPFYQELQGQFLFEQRNFDAAIGAYARAADLAPREALIQAGYGRALLAADTPARNRDALAVLQRAYGLDPVNPRMLRDLALALARDGQNGMASSVTAERYAVLGQLDTARIHATRAVGLLPEGSPGWLRAQDVIRVADAAAARRN